MSSMEVFDNTLVWFKGFCYPYIRIARRSEVRKHPDYARVASCCSASTRAKNACKTISLSENYLKESGSCAFLRKNIRIV